ncbi:DUF2784 domain-containing protein [Saccharomonospora piscinae]|uniref:DUF2784 domain-containing protein n=1 Tax=Saccharomonospora piscinae TaxID=687388 RepID=A0A1V9A0I4_SACPI|nr:DUF2784 domain-containing protein [Saccharomonospora piscinae]OQO90581.1 hypothetical protein B1813_13560 [Saccharomonospora piscinae]TLW93248.1 DUF2784 domain-containing protein [Saccharomonospora piscinae]
MLGWPETLERLTALTTGLHVLALLYIGLGGFLAWWVPRSIVVHVGFAAWGVAVTLLPLTCPLTAVEDFLRELRGLGPLPGGFNEHYLYDTVVPRELLPAVGVAALVLVATSYAGCHARARARRDTAVSRPSTMAE